MAAHTTRVEAFCLGPLVLEVATHPGEREALERYRLRLRPQSRGEFPGIDPGQAAQSERIRRMHVALDRLADREIEPHEFVQQLRRHLRHREVA